MAAGVDEDLGRRWGGCRCDCVTRVPSVVQGRWWGLRMGLTSVMRCVLGLGSTHGSQIHGGHRDREIRVVVQRSADWQKLESICLGCVTRSEVVGRWSMAGGVVLGSEYKS